MMITFDYLWLLPLAVILPIAIVWLLARADRQRRARFARLGEPEIVQRLLPPNAMRSRGTGPNGSLINASD